TQKCLTNSRSSNGLNHTNRACRQTRSAPPCFCFRFPFEKPPDTPRTPPRKHMNRALRAISESAATAFRSFPRLKLTRDDRVRPTSRHIRISCAIPEDLVLNALSFRACDPDRSAIHPPVGIHYTAAG